MAPRVEKMFYYDGEESVNGMPWWIGTSHDTGQAARLLERPTWEQVREVSGLDWDPVESTLNRDLDLNEVRKVFAEIVMNAELPPVLQLDALVLAAYNAQHTVQGWKHIGRSDNPAQTLACTQESYRVLPNSEFGKIFEALLGQDNVLFETAGCLDDGKQVWVLVKLNEPISIPGDSTVSYPFMSLMSRHDAKGSTALRTTNVRIVCGNTFDYAELQGESNGLVYRFVHRGDWKGHLEEARAAVTGVRKQAKKYEELAGYLIEVPVTPAQRKLFIASFFPEPPRGEASDRVLANVAASREKLNEILDGPTRPDGDSAYWILQGAGEYGDWAVNSRNWETKVKRTLLKPDPLKRRALQILAEVCDLDPKKVKVTQEISEAGLLVA